MKVKKWSQGWARGITWGGWFLNSVIEDGWELARCRCGALPRGREVNVNKNSLNRNEETKMTNKGNCIKKGKPGTSLVLQWLRLHTPSGCRGPGSISARGARSQMLQQRLRFPRTTTETQHSQINKIDRKRRRTNYKMLWEVGYVKGVTTANAYTVLPGWLALFCMCAHLFYFIYLLASFS